MHKIAGLLRLMRWVNLVVVFLTQLCFYYFVMFPSIPKSLMKLTPFRFFLLTLATLMVAAGGNIVNDLYDKYPDSINKPQKKSAFIDLYSGFIIRSYYFLTLGAFGIGIYFGILSRDFKVASMVLLAAGLLWFYNVSLKSLPLIGNLVISLLCSLSIVLVFLAEDSFFWIDEYDAFFAESVQRVYYLMWGYAVFAFLTTLIRELIKDMQDVEGDSVAGYKTLPVLLGNKSKILILVLIAVLIGGLISITVELLPVASYHAYYIIGLLIIPSAILIPLILVADKPEHYSISSTIVKLVMIFGILSMPAFHYLNLI